MIIPKVVSNVKPKKIVFDDDGEILNNSKQVSKENSKNGTHFESSETKKFVTEEDTDGEEDYFSMREKKSKKKSSSDQQNSDVPKKWYNVVRNYFYIY